MFFIHKRLTSRIAGFFSLYPTLIHQNTITNKKTRPQERKHEDIHIMPATPPPHPTAKPLHQRSYI